MAARKSYVYFGSAEKINPINPESQFEFDESEVWASEGVGPSDTHQEKKPRALKKPSKKGGGGRFMDKQMPVAGTSLPVKIPDWSRILGEEYKARQKGSDDDDDNDDNDDDEYGRLPPHEYLARTRGSSLSVHEGIGRTLKGRDMSRVRDAVWKQIGFED